MNLKRLSDKGRELKIGGGAVEIIIFGGTGLIGQELAATALTAGHTVRIASRLLPSRNRAKPSYGNLIPYTLDTLPSLLNGLTSPYAIVNLAGESLQSGRWTNQRKRRIRDSRIALTTALAQAINTVAVKPHAFISGSAVGYYGTSEQATFMEGHPRGEGFLAEVTNEWEEAAGQAESSTRIVYLRTGLVLSRRGGAFPRIVQPYRMYIGGRIGSGRQWLSWIHEHDMATLILWCIAAGIQGPVNATAPNPVRMSEMGQTIAQVLRRPHWLPVPGIALKSLLGEMSELVLEGQHVSPQTALTGGYRFDFPDILPAAMDILRGSG